MNKLNLAQKVADQLMRVSSSTGSVSVTYTYKGKSDLAKMTFSEVVGRARYEKHLEEIFGPDWKNGEITKVKGLPPGLFSGGFSFEEFWDALNVCSEFGYYVVEAAIKVGLEPLDVKNKFRGQFDSLEDLGYFLVYSKEGDISSRLGAYVDYEGYAEEYSEEFKWAARASNGKYYAFW